MPNPEPVDSDLDAVGPTRPSLPSWRHVLFVFIGGTIGTSARAAIAADAPSAGGFPVAIFAINLVGAFLLGVVVEFLLVRGPDEGTRRSARLFVGTGVLGGFTTYSTVATDAARLLVSAPLLAVGYLTATVLLGATASCAGIIVGRRLGRVGR